MNFKVKCSNNISKNLKKLEDNAKKNSGNSVVSFDELFCNEFMRKNTNIDSIDEFFRCAGFKMETKEDFDNLAENILNEAVARLTSFSTWDEMAKQAGLDYAKKKLFEGI